MPVGEEEAIVTVSGSSGLSQRLRGVIRKDFAKPSSLPFFLLTVKENQGNDLSSNQMSADIQWEFLLRMRRDICDL